MQGVPLQLESAEWSAWGAVHPLLSILTMVLAAFVLASVGSLVGGALAIGLALFQFWGDWVSIAIIAGIFGAGQFIEGNILTPKLVGNSVGLHPVWLLFALSAFGSLFGFVGMLVAVPVAAAIGVFARFGLQHYQSSLLYNGYAGQPQPQEAAPTAKDEAAE